MASAKPKQVRILIGMLERAIKTLESEVL